MSADPSAYRALGLEPGADAAAVEAAYRKLIKRYHPDREGGDGQKAAQVNRAYREIRNVQHQLVARSPAASGSHVRGAFPQKRGRGGGGWVVVILLALGVGFLLSGPWLTEAVVVPEQPVHMAADRERGSAPSVIDVGVPIDSVAVERAAFDAVRLAESGNADRLAEQSRTCHAQLRRRPDVGRLDRCVAFDEAALTIMQSKSAPEVGPFSPAMVLARQIAAAKLLSNDYLAMESRLGQVRTLVELSLAPSEPLPEAYRPQR